jgi:AcrR family transcriptional regulator
MNRLEKTPPSKSDETSTRILEAALDVFRREGFEKATMREIAREAGVALGAAYYYYESKNALVMAFYERAQTEMAPSLDKALEKPRDLQSRLKAVIQVKLNYFEKDRSLLGALSAHIDPSHSLSPFSKQTAQIREKDILFFRRALDGSRQKPHAELQEHLPKLIWMYQMGLLLYWTYDSSPGQQRTHALFEKTLGIVSTLVRYSGIPVLRPLRKLVRELMDLAFGEGQTADTK